MPASNERTRTPRHHRRDLTAHAPPGDPRQRRPGGVGVGVLLGVTAAPRSLTGQAVAVLQVQAQVGHRPGAQQLEEPLAVVVVDVQPRRRRQRRRAGGVAGEQAQGAAAPLLRRAVVAGVGRHVRGVHGLGPGQRDGWRRERGVEVGQLVVEASEQVVHHRRLIVPSMRP
ncbi:MAG: hypothetical protein PGN11_19520 [Quadrisphaera sp.]